MIEKFEKYQVIVMLVLVILIMTVVKIKYSWKGEVGGRPTNETIKVTPTSTVDKDHPLQGHLPYQGKGFVIDKYNSPMTLNLKLTGATQQQAAKEIGVWLDSFGEAGSGHIIEWEEASAAAKKNK